ncbi:hypothetical protein [Novosphingobium sp.]|uniref:hypothetical protein n=1 Tax=Novosphingobium sp. TaxID=1874826 RepID=UPI003BABE4D5
MVALLKRIGCAIGRHAPSRRAVEYEGHLKIGPCRFCGQALEKGGDGRWVSRKGSKRAPRDETTKHKD